jgi:hypothetical protein
MTSVRTILLGDEPDPLLAPFDYDGGETWEERYLLGYESPLVVGDWSTSGRVAHSRAANRWMMFYAADLDNTDDSDFIDRCERRVDAQQPLTSEELQRIRDLYWAWIVEQNQAFACAGAETRWWGYNGAFAP